MAWGMIYQQLELAYIIRSIFSWMNFVDEVYIGDYVSACALSPFANKLLLPLTPLMREPLSRDGTEAIETPVK